MYRYSNYNEFDRPSQSKTTRERGIVENRAGRAAPSGQSGVGEHRACLEPGL